jgi:EAL domain-containing protein (putative c-di-GMP-specific phosphodiesterase class I)
MNRADEIERARQLEEDADQLDRWEDDPAPSPVSGNLAAQITFRIEAVHAATLRRIARERGVAYTALVREWIEDHLAEEAEAYTVSAPLRGHPIIAQASSSEDDWQITTDEMMGIKVKVA